MEQALPLEHISGLQLQPLLALQAPGQHLQALLLALRPPGEVLQQPQLQVVPPVVALLRQSRGQQLLQPGGAAGDGGPQALEDLPMQPPAVLPQVDQHTQGLTALQLGPQEGRRVRHQGPGAGAEADPVGGVEPLPVEDGEGAALQPLGPGGQPLPQAWGEAGQEDTGLGQAAGQQGDQREGGTI